MAQRERARHVPSPLNFSPRSPPPLLYDLPTTTLSSSVSTPKSPRSPPRTPRGRAQALLSPKTATFSSLHGARASNITLQHPQPSLYTPQGSYNATTPNRSVARTPTQLDAFGSLCRAWFFQQDPQAGAQIQEILRTIPASQRASYTRLQAQIRSSYHAAVALRRESEFHAHLTSTKPGQSLTPMNRHNPASQLAKQERRERMQKLVNVWATSGNVGTKPFFEGLFAVLRLQGLPENLGGAGHNRMSWEVDDAVFKESAGKEFMLEAIDVLKGVLGFEEAVVPSRSRSRDALSLSTMAHDRPQSPPTSFKPPPPPLPNRPEPRTQGLTTGVSESRKGRPLPSIASASLITRRRDSSAHQSNDGLVDDEDDAFADPVVRHERSTSFPSSTFHRPTSTFSQGNAGSPSQKTHDVLNRNRSPSDPFADTNGHLNFGYANRRSRTQGSLGTLPEPGPSPSMTPLLANGEGSSAGTTSNSVLAGKGSISTGSELKKTVPLPPPEDFELDLAGPSRAMALQRNTASAVTPDSDEDEGTELFHETERPSKRASGFSFGMMGRNRRGSETTGLGLVGPGLDPSPSKASVSTRSIMTQPETPRPLNNGVISLATPPRPGSTTLNVIDSYAPVDDEPHLRTWTVPAYLGNPEIAQLLGVFPTNISGGSVPRFKGSINNKSKERQSASIRSRRAPEELDLEAQEDEEEPTDDKEWLRYGTGRLCLTKLERGEGWMGSMWERLKNWWRRVFC